MEYEILFEFTAHKTIFLEANDEDEAYELASTMSQEDNFFLDAGDYESGQLELVEVTERI